MDHHVSIIEDRGGLGFYKSQPRLCKIPVVHDNLARGDQRRAPNARTPDGDAVNGSHGRVFHQPLEEGSADESSGTGEHDAEPLRIL